MSRMLKGVYLTLMIGPAVPVLAPQEVVEALTSVQVNVSATERSGFQLTFTFGKRSMIGQSLLPAGYFDPGIRVIIIATLGGAPNVLMDGIITRQEMNPSSEPGQNTLTVTGEDLTLLMDLIDRTGEPYPAMTTWMIVNRILAEYAVFGVIPLVMPELFPSIRTPVQRFRSQQGTHLSYIRSLAAEAGYVFYLDPGPAPGTSTAYFGPEIRVGVPQAALSVNWDGHTNVESLSFSFDGLSREQIIAFIQIPELKAAIPVPVPDVSLLKPPLAARPPFPLKWKFQSEVAKLDLAEAAGRLLANGAAGADAISGNGSLDVLRYGRLLKARGLVGVRGAGLAYDGLYYVKSVSHTIKRGEYKQSFSLVRNGLIPLTPGVPV